jgi:hypothetical protein
VIAAYDLMNEPFADYKTDVTPVLRPLMFKTFEAIRSTGDQHVILFPQALGRGVYFYGDVRAKGYQQFAFTDHFYPGLFGSPSTLASHAHEIRRNFVDIQRYLDEQRAPFLAGEFNVVLDRCGGELMMRKYYDEFERRGWMATMWSYKLLKRDGGVQADNWYMVTNADALPAIDLRNDSFETIESFFQSLATVPIAADEELRAALTTSSAPRIELPAPIDLPKNAPTVQRADGLTGVAVGNAAGGVEQRDGHLIVTARGSDVFGNADNFYFIQSGASDRQMMTVQVDRLLDSGAYAKAGVMLRFGDPADPSYASAPFVMVNVFPNGDVALLHRDNSGESAKETKRHPGPLPLRIGLMRDGPRVTAIVAGAGGNWVNIGNVEIAATVTRAPSQFGIAVTSHSGSAFTRAEFSRLERKDLQQFKVDTTFVAPAAESGKSLAKWNTWGTVELAPNATFDFAYVGAGDSGVWQDVGVATGKPQRFIVNVSRADANLPRDAGFVELRLETTMAGKQIAIASREFDFASLESGDGASALSIDVTPAAPTLRLLIRIVPRNDARPVSLRFSNARLLPR